MLLRQAPPAGWPGLSANLKPLVSNSAGAAPDRQPCLEVSNGADCRPSGVRDIRPQAAILVGQYRGIDSPERRFGAGARLDQLGPVRTATIAIDAHYSARSVTKIVESVDPKAKVNAEPVTQKVTIGSAAPAEAFSRALGEAGYPATAA